MSELGHSVLVEGPSGAGKSTVGRSALLHEGSGVVFAARGDDELASYDEFRGRPGYFLRGFDDPEFQPLLGLRTATGLKEAIHGLREVVRVVTAEPGKYKVLVGDTLSGFAQLGLNAACAKHGVDGPPEGKDSPSFWTDVRLIMESFMTPMRSLKGLGVHIIGTTHVGEKEMKETALAAPGITSKLMHTPLISGAFRDILPGYFDLVVHAGVNGAGKLLASGWNDPGNHRHYVLSEPDPKRLTKSRLGPLSATGRLPNEWAYIKAALDAARARRREAFDSRA